LFYLSFKVKVELLYSSINFKLFVFKSLFFTSSTKSDSESDLNVLLVKNNDLNTNNLKLIDEYNNSTLTLNDK
jgi:hypothetical protein